MDGTIGRYEVQFFCVLVLKASVTGLYSLNTRNFRFHYALVEGTIKKFEAMKINQLYVSVEPLLS